MKCSFFQAAFVSTLLYGCTTWMLTKRMAATQKSCKQFWTSPDGNTPHSSRCTTTYPLPSRKLSKLDEPDMQDTAGEAETSDVLLWTLSHGRAKAGRPDRTYIQQLCEDTVCSPEDLLEAMNDREEWRERESQGYPCWWYDKRMMTYAKLNLAQTAVVAEYTDLISAQG